jgi:hypothetical protein
LRREIVAWINVNTYAQSLSRYFYGMPDTFELPLQYNGKDITLNAELQAFGYTHKIKMAINEVDFFFEPDDEKNYRAVVALEDRDKAEKIDRHFLQTISETLHELFSK